MKDPNALLQGMLNKYPKLQKKLKDFEKLHAWEKIVGPNIAKNVKVKDLKEKVLYLETHHPAWKQEILFRKEVLIQRLQEEIDVEEIVIIDETLTPSWLKGKRKGNR